MITAEDKPGSENAGAPLDPMRLGIGIWRRRWFVAAMAVIGTVIGAIVAKTLIPPVFEARGVVECDRCSETGFGDRELATLQESVKLPQHMERVRQKLGLETTIEAIDRDVEVNASIESRLIQVTARAKSGEVAAGMVNIIVDAFMETRLSVEQDKLLLRVRKAVADTDKARAVVLDARDRYDRFRRQNDIADLPAERQAAIEEAARLRSELAIARGEEQAEQARMTALRRLSSNEPATTVLQETQESPAARSLAEKRVALKSARARLSGEHPNVLSLSAEVETLEHSATSEDDSITTARIIGRNPQWDLAQQGILDANAKHEAASTRQSTYAKLAQQAAQAAARLSDIEGRGSELLSNAKTAEQHLATLEIALKMAEDAARTPSTGLRILASARTPTVPVKSSRRVVAFLGPLIGVLLATIAVLLYELRGLRVYSATELAFWGNAPVLTASQWPRVPKALGDIVTELTLPLGQSTGKTLLVGFGATELAASHALAYELHEALESDASATNHSNSVEAVASVESRADLRHAVRNADRVIVLVSAGAYSVMKLRSFIHDLGKPERMGFVLLNIRSEHVALPDRIGDDGVFWNA